MSDAIKNINDDQFEAEVLQAKGLVLVDFWAEWCGPCKAISPVLEKMAETYAGRMQVTKVNVEHNTETPAKYGVRGIPTLLLIKDGQEVAKHVGGMSAPQMVAFIEAQL